MAAFPISHISYSGQVAFLVDGQQTSPALACGVGGICLVAYEDNCCLLNTDNEIRGKILFHHYRYLPLIEK